MRANETLAKLVSLASGHQNGGATQNVSKLLGAAERIIYGIDSSSQVGPSDMTPA